VFLFNGKESHPRSLLKAISWRMLGSIDTFILGMIFTSDAKAAGAIAGTEVITKIGLYYLHERAWAASSWGTHGRCGGRGTPSDAYPGRAQGVASPAAMIRCAPRLASVTRSRMLAVSSRTASMTRRMWQAFSGTQFLHFS
jgi:uncharacterized membrane protein